MKIAFCIDDNPAYLPLLKVAARSLFEVQGKGQEAICVYAGESRRVMETIRGEGLTLARYSPRLDPAIMPPEVLHSRGCFLKLELGLLPELAGDDRVLYCDLDVLFRKPLDDLFQMALPPYMGMVRENTAPFYHDVQSMDYEFMDHRYTVPMPFPIWTYSSAVVLFNLGMLRKRHLLDHFLAFSLQNVYRIGNLDQSLLNYFFGKRITRLENRWNSPPYMVDSREHGHIVHFHGPKPWDTTREWASDLRVNHFESLRQIWYGYLDSREREQLKKEIVP